MTSDEFDNTREEIRHVTTLGHAGKEPFHTVDEYGGG